MKFIIYVNKQQYDTVIADFVMSLTIQQYKKQLDEFNVELDRSAKHVKKIQKKIKNIQNTIHARVRVLNTQLLQTIPPELMVKIMLYTLKCPFDIEKQEIPKWINTSGLYHNLVLPSQTVNEICTESKKGYTIITETVRCTILRNTKSEATYCDYFVFGDIGRLQGFNHVIYDATIVNFLHMLNTRKCNWSNGHYLISCSEVKKLARLNQIKGRSKFKTRVEYIQALMKL